MLEDEGTETVTTDDSLDTQEDSNWEQRFKDTQASYTKSQQALRDAESVWEDEQALIARIAEKHPHLIAPETDDVEEYEDDDDSSPDPDVMTKQEFKTWQDEQKAEAQAKEAQQVFESDFHKFIGDRDLDQYGEAALRAGTYKGPEELQAAIDGYFEHLDSLGGTKRKRRPTPPLPGGKTATGVPDYSDMTSDQVNAAMVERARALEAQ